MRLFGTAAIVAALAGLFSAAMAASANVHSAPSGFQIISTPTRDTLVPGAPGAQLTASPTRDTLVPGPGGAQLTPSPTLGAQLTPSPTRETLAPGVSGAQQQPPLTATLIGAAEVPGPGATDGMGSAAITLDQAQGTVCYALHVANIAPAIAAHIHQGAVDVEGPIVVHLNPPAEGNSSDCIQGVERELVTRIMQDPRGFYVNVHNADFPAGAIRGQLTR
jgi:hypothetical protein